jgi:hypothetical protein
LKDKIFKRPEFVAKTRNFIPVYLDGDDESAQTIGEGLGVKGYPTVIIFGAEGEELMRMPSSIPVEQYADLLDRAVLMTQPIKQILTDVLAQGPSQSTDANLSLLAYHSWDQDDRVDLTDDEGLQTFRQLYQETPDRLRFEKSRFLALYLSAAIEHSTSEETRDLSTLSDQERSTLRTAVLALLADPELLSANLELVIFLSTETVDLLAPAAGSERSQLIEHWIAAARNLESSEALSKDDRLSALFPQIWLPQIADPDLEDATPSEEVFERIRDRVKWATETITDESELQAVLNTLAHLLHEANLNDEAESLLAATLKDTRAPYYFMSWIASLKEEAGESALAIDWYRRAYESSHGRYSRFRWGSTYLRKLIALDADNLSLIEEQSVEVLQELLEFDEAFAGGNHSRLQRLAAAYEYWDDSSDRTAVTSRIRNLVQSECDRFPGVDEDSAQARCKAFLAS